MASGGALYAAGSTRIERCTFCGNWAGYASGYGGSIYCEGAPPIDRTVIAFGEGGGAVDGGNPLLSCCDFYGNLGGDWVGVIAGQCGLNGNISADPLFCHPGEGDYRLDSTSPCLFGPCGWIGAYDQGCWGEAPRITAVGDVGTDQGGQVRIGWLRSAHDAQGEPVVTGYGIYRRQDARSEAMPDPGDKPGGKRVDGWDFIATAPARGVSLYQLIAPTLCDSKAEGGICWPVFFVSAMTTDPLLFFDSAPDSGYSVDNLAPGVPSGLHRAGPLLLAWSACPDEDFDYFTLYGSAVDHLDNTATRIAYTIETSHDITGHVYPFYHLTASDIAGNESEAATLAGVSCGPDMDPGSVRFALHAILPNPVHPHALVSYDLPTACQVRLTVLDPTGREVVRLVDRCHAAGRHVVVWRSIHAGGAALPSGIYYLRLETTGRRATRGVLLV